MGDVVESPLYIILGSGSLEELLSPQHMIHGLNLWSISILLLMEKVIF